MPAGSCRYPLGSAQGFKEISNKRTGVSPLCARDKTKEAHRRKSVVREK